MDGNNCEANRDLLFLSDEKFDFDVSLSPASSRGDEDEEDEKCVTVNEASPLEIGGGVCDSWIPLTEDQLEAICQEAHRVADQLQSKKLNPPHDQDDQTADAVSDVTTNREKFVQDADAKLGLFGASVTALSPVKRQTFCVQDSPMKQLPPAIQRHLQRENRSSSASSSRPVTTAPSSTRSTRLSSTRLSTSSSDTKPRMSLRGKPMLGGVLPNKLVVPSTSCSATKSKVEGTRLPPPSKTASWRRSPSPLLSTRAESSDDLFSDTASVASDISDSSLNSSVVGKGSLVPPTKNVRNLSGVKAPPPQSKRVIERKNTSSSSRQSASPTTGKLNTSLSQRLSSCAVPAPGSVSTPVNQTRPRRSIAHAAAQPSAAGRRSLSTQAKKLPEATKTTPLKRGAATPLQTAPAKRVSERITSARQPSGPKVLVPPTPRGGVKTVQHGESVLSPEVSKLLKPKRSMSVSSMDSLPQKPFVPLTPSAGGCRSLQVMTRRPSAIPTPLRHRTSAIPVATPPTQTCPKRQLPISDSDSSSAERESDCSPAPTDTLEAEPVDALDIQPFCLEEEPSVAPPPTAPQTDQSESVDTVILSQSKSEPGRNLIELEMAEERNNQEVLLVDLPPPVLQPKEKLLIDLANTPEPIQTYKKTGTMTQLIDLSSPLIKWSPEDKKENNAPLINLSF